MVVDNFMLAYWSLGLSFDLDDTCLSVIHLSRKKKLEKCDHV